MKLLFVVVFIVVYTKLFSFASGGLSIRHLNLVSLVYYITLITNVIGGSIVFLGFRDHYLVVKASDQAITNAYLSMALALCLVPITIRLVSGHSHPRKHLKQSSDPNLIRQLDSTHQLDIPYDSRLDESTLFSCVLFVTILCAAAALYSFLVIGQIPLLNIIFGSGDFATQRISNSRGREGFIQLTNLVFLQTAPALAYICRAFARTKANHLWNLLFFVNLTLAILALTFSYAKSPLAMFFIGLLLLDIQLNKAQSFRTLIRYAFLIGGILVAAYIVIAQNDNSWFSLSTGPLSRLLIGQIASLFLHFEAFPSVFPFQSGASFPSWVGQLLGYPDWGTRSARLIAIAYAPTGVESGTTGVINTIFVGEAYANWGFLGVLLGSIWVGIYIGFVYRFFTSRLASPLMTAGYVIFTMDILTMIEGGMIDFLYSSSMIYEVLLFGMLVLLSYRKQVAREELLFDE